ncbi:MAG: FMN-binding protein [Clostridiales bacterium]|nr:FMN-binding protein [Clostridiales bacterium]
MKKEFIKPVIAATLFAVVAAVLLGLTFSVTEGPIAERRAQQAAEALENLLPGAYRVETMNLNISGSNLTRMYRAFDEYDRLLGHAFAANPTGYGGTIDMMTAFNPSGYILGLEVLNHSETPGIGAIISQDFFAEAFVDRIGILVPSRRATSPQEIDVAVGATISLNAVLRGLNDATRYLGFEEAGAPLTPPTPPLYPSVASLIPGTRFTEFHHVNRFAGFSVEWMASSHDRAGTPLGYVFFTSPTGYHGPIEMAVVTSTTGEIRNLYIIDHMETWSMGGRILDLPGFNQQFIGHSFDRELELIEINTTTFATVSLTSVVRGINDAMHYFNRHHR